MDNNYLCSLSFVLFLLMTGKRQQCGKMTFPSYLTFIVSLVYHILLVCDLSQNYLDEITMVSA